MRSCYCIKMDADNKNPAHRIRSRITTKENTRERYETTTTAATVIRTPTKPASRRWRFFFGGKKDYIWRDATAISEQKRVWASWPFSWISTWLGFPLPSTHVSLSLSLFHKSVWNISCRQSKNSWNEEATKADCRSSKPPSCERRFKWSSEVPLWRTHLCDEGGAICHKIRKEDQQLEQSSIRFCQYSFSSVPTFDNPHQNKTPVKVRKGNEVYVLDRTRRLDRNKEAEKPLGNGYILWWRGESIGRREITERGREYIKNN